MGLNEARTQGSCRRWNLQFSAVTGSLVEKYENWYVKGKIWIWDKTETELERWESVQIVRVGFVEF